MLQPSRSYDRRIYHKRNVSPRRVFLSASSQLERRYKVALSGAVVAKAHYLALVGKANVSAVSVEKARWKWERIEARRNLIAEELLRLRRSEQLGGQ